MSKKKRKSNKQNQNIKKQSVEEKKILSSDSAVGWVCLLVALLAVAILFFVFPIHASNVHSSVSAEPVQAEQKPEDAEAFESFTGTDLDGTPEALYADITVENYGTITVQLDSQAAPLTVSNFVSLAQDGFYDGLTFHRIMDGFMMQGGDPTGTGSGGSGTNLKGEFSENGWDNPLSHTRGAISMARATDYDSASCQFFIVQSDSTFLDGKYACFGYVTEGMEYVDAICADAKPTDDNGSIPADQQPVITSIVIRSA